MSIQDQLETADEKLIGGVISEISVELLKEKKNAMWMYLETERLGDVEMVKIPLINPITGTPYVISAVEGVQPVEQMLMYGEVISTEIEEISAAEIKQVMAEECDLQIAEEIEGDKLVTVIAVYIDFWTDEMSEVGDNNVVVYLHPDALQYLE